MGVLLVALHECLSLNDPELLAHSLFMIGLGVFGVAMDICVAYHQGGLDDRA